MSDLLIASRSARKCRSIAERVREAKQRRSQRIRALVIVSFTALTAAGAGHADSQDSMQSIDEQVQEIKSDVLAIAAELQQLEEKLLYPSNTQLAVFVSLSDGDALELDSVHIQIDGERVADHIYEFKELVALRKGGVQRIYTGNVPTGEHRMEVAMTGRFAGGSEFEETQSFAFNKEVEPKFIDLTLAGRAVGGVQIAFEGE